LREVLKRIQDQQAEYAKGAFLAFLRDTNVDVRQRLAFAPHVAHYVLTFADLCTMVLPEEPPSDRYQELVNANCFEDKQHWQWFLADLGRLDQDPELPFSDAVRLIWSDATLRTRRLSYHLVHLGLAESSLGRLVLVHIIEGAFAVTVKDLGPAAREFVSRTGKPLQYLGQSHSEAESSHTIEESAVRRAIEEIQLSAEQVQRYCKMVDECFALFRGFSDEMYDLARSTQLKAAAPSR